MSTPADQGTQGVVSSWLYAYRTSGMSHARYLHVRLRRQHTDHPSPREHYKVKPCHGATA